MMRWQRHATEKQGLAPDLAWSWQVLAAELQQGAKQFALVQVSRLTRKLVEKIQANEYMEFADLIPAGGRSRVPTPQGDRQIMVIQAADLMTTRKVIPDLATWLQCFVVYVAVLGPYQPDKLADLMGYQSLIARASKKFKWPSWLVYDQNFRQEAAGNTSLQWAKAEPSLYAQCFTGQEISKENWCSRCHGVDHQYGKRTWSGGPGAVSHSQGQQQQEGVTNNSASSLTNTVEIASLEKNASFCTLVQVARDHTQCQNAGQVARRRWVGWTKLNSTGRKGPQLFDSHIVLFMLLFLFNVAECQLCCI